MISKSQFLAAAVGFLVLFTLLNAGPTAFANYLILGLTYGGIVALIAMGYSMVYGIIQLINFAHGEIFMLGSFLFLMLTLPLGDASGTGFDARLASAAVAFAAVMGFCALVATWTIFEDIVRGKAARAAFSAAVGVATGWAMHRLFLARVPFFAALPIAVLMTPAFGIAMDTLAYRPLRKAPRLVPLITAIGVSLLLMNAAQLFFGTKDYRFPPDIVPDILRPFIFGPGAPKLEELGFWQALVQTRTVYFTEQLQFPLVDAVILFTTIVTMVAVNAFVQHTKTGTAMRACALDQNTARLCGIDVNRTVALTFAIGAGLAALAAPLYTIKYSAINPTMGYSIGILAFSSAVLGGIGNIRGAMLGGFAIGIIYSFVPLYEQARNWPFFKWLAGYPSMAKYQDIFAGISQWNIGVAYLFLILVIILRPQGLLGTAAAGKRA